MTNQTSPAVILVHGFLDSGEAWRPVLNIIGASANGWCIPDLPGMGRLWDAEGPFTLGQTFLVKVKNPDKLHAALDQAIKAIGQATGADVSVKKKKYRGVELREVHVHQQGFFFLPTYAMHDGWLVLGYYPQNVQGYILRATGEVPAKACTLAALA